MTSAWDDYAAGSEAEIAAHFPAPSPEVADRLLGLLLPRNRKRKRKRTKRQSAA